MSFKPVEKHNFRKKQQDSPMFNIELSMANKLRELAYASNFEFFDSLSEAKKIFLLKVEILIQEIEKREAVRLGLPIKETDLFDVKNFDLLQRRYAHKAEGAFIASSSEILIAETDLDFFDINALRIFVKFLHENVHRHQLYLSNDGPEGIRLGYRETTKNNESLFLVLNEGATQAYVNDLLYLYKDIILKIFPNFSETLYGTGSLQISLYQNETNLVHYIQQQVGYKYPHLSRGPIRDMFALGMFTGEKMWLRLIEKTFGKGALSRLAHLKSGDDYIAIINKTK